MNKPLFNLITIGSKGTEVFKVTAKPDIQQNKLVFVLGTNLSEVKKQLKHK